MSRHPQGDNLPDVNVSPIERAASAAAGGLLLYNAIANKGKLGWASAIAGGYLLYRGTSGYCAVYDAIGKQQLPVPYKTINIKTKLIVNKPRNEVYSFWRKLENLPLFMTHLESVEKVNEKRSIWKAKFPGGLVPLKWEAEILKERENEFIGWSSTTDATIRNAGKVEFKDALGGRGTEINVVIAYHPPLGVIGSGLSKLFNKKLEKLIKKDVQNFKSYIETGVNEKEASALEKKARKTAGRTTKSLVSSAAQGIIDGLEGRRDPVIGRL